MCTQIKKCIIIPKWKLGTQKKYPNKKVCVPEWTGYLNKKVFVPIWKLGSYPPKIKKCVPKCTYCDYLISWTLVCVIVTLISPHRKFHPKKPLGGLALLAQLTTEMLAIVWTSGTSRTVAQIYTTIIITSYVATGKMFQQVTNRSYYGVFKVKPPENTSNVKLILPCPPPLSIS